MNRAFLFLLALLTAIPGGFSFAQENQDIEKACDIVSNYFPVVKNDQKNFYKIDYRLGWNKKAPYKISVQFINLGYASRKAKFAIKDLTSKKMIVLDPARNSRVVVENLNPASAGAIWSGLVDGIKDSFSVRVWDVEGNEIDEPPISIRNKH